MIKYLILLSLLSPECFAEAQDYNEAAQKAVEAWYVDSSVRQVVQYKLELYQEKIPKKYKKTLEIILPLVDTIIKQRVELKYEF